MLPTIDEIIDAWAHCAFMDQANARMQRKPVAYRPLTISLALFIMGSPQYANCDGTGEQARLFGSPMTLLLFQDCTR